MSWQHLIDLLLVPILLRLVVLEVSNYVEGKIFHKKADKKHDLILDKLANLEAHLGQGRVGDSEPKA